MLIYLYSCMFENSVGNYVAYKLVYDEIRNAITLRVLIRLYIYIYTPEYELYTRNRSV